jgi:nitrate reductase NapD
MIIKKEWLKDKFMNICSLIVNTKPENALKVKSILEKMENVDIFGGVEEGRIIITVEDNGERALSDQMAALNDIEGVIDAAMVYHQEADDSTIEEEIV